MIIKLGNKIQIGNNLRPLIVAEISGNHCGNKKKFLNHIKVAKESGADLVKIQTYEPEDITSNKNKYYIQKGLWKSKSLWSLYNKAHTPISWHKDAFRLAKKLKIQLFSTPFSIRCVDILEKFKVSIYKISSLEITDYNLIKYIASKRKPIILSTGSANINEIKKAVKIINKYHNKIILLHCISKYPTKEENAQIRSINFLRKKFKKNLIGLSDHTKDIFSSLASVPLGAVLIEKHFKTDEKLKSVDSNFSIDPIKMRNLKRFSEQMFISLGEKKFKNFKIENESLFFRRSLFAKINIEKGERFSEKNIVSLRPLIGVGAENFFKIIGKKSKNKIKAGYPILRKNI